MNSSNAPPLTVAEVSALGHDDFVARLGDIFEHSPWVADRAWAARPFGDVDTLHAAMAAAVENASAAEQLALIRAHPELGGREAAAGTLTAASTDEQHGAGLDRCSADELQHLRGLNTAYRERFGFPLVIAVKGRSRHEIMDIIEMRLQRDADTEFRTCLDEIRKITRLRLDARFARASCTNPGKKTP